MVDDDHTDSYLPFIRRRRHGAANTKGAKGQAKLGTAAAQREKQT